MGSRTYSDEQIDDLVAKRLAEKKQTVLEVLDALRPELEGMRREISAANHVKQELAEELRANTRATEDLGERLDAHANLSFHRVGAQLIDETGLLTLSQEERRALPEMLREDVQVRRNRRAYDRRERRRTVVLQLIATVVGTVAGTAVATTAALSYMAAHHP